MTYDITQCSYMLATTVYIVIYVHNISISWSSLIIDTYYVWFNSPVSHKLKYLWNVNEPQLTKVAQHPVASWRPLNVQKSMGLQASSILGVQIS